MSDEPWHLSRSVPITFLFAILLQTVALIWFVATLRNDVDTNRTEIIRLEARTGQLETVVQSQAITMARMDENIKAIRDAVETMANK
jgi:type VI protein secretion system component VasK